MIETRGFDEAFELGEVVCRFAREADDEGGAKGDAR